MTSEGVSVRDLLPIPDNFEIVTKPDDPDNEETANTLADEPTMSHALAMADHEIKGSAQEAHDQEVKNLGWHEEDDKMPDPLVGGLPNEELWILIRRFNKQMYHVKEYTRPVPGNLDLNIADEDEFSPDKLRASIERLYMTVFVGLLGFWKQIARLRSWHETRRTATFCVAFSVAWLFDFLVPLLSAFLTTLIVYPPSRSIAFPPAPLALVNAKTGGVQKPKAGVLASTDSATGAPENYKGEAVEAEASHFVNSIATVALSSASGKHPQNDPPGLDEDDDGVPKDKVPDPTAIATGASNARMVTSGADGKVKPKHDKAKVPMETTIWNQMRPAMHGIASVCDTWEEFGNALSPTPPFPRDIYRLRLAALVVPLLAISILTSSYMFVKSSWFAFGFVFFGDPVIQPALRWLNTNYPNWQKLLELRNTVLKGVPTNAQLTITLLRTGEANKAPLPPAPRGDEPPPDEPIEMSEEHLRAVGADPPLNATDEEIRAAIEHDPNTKNESTGADVEASKQRTHGSKASHMLSAAKASLKGSIETALGADHVKAKVGSEHSKNRLGVVPRHRKNHLTGPVEFKCRYHGKRGYAYIKAQDNPRVSFTDDKTVANEGSQGKEDQELKPIWTVAVADIKELKKIGGLGWKSKLVVGWALERELADGLEIVDKQDNRYVVTAMVLRDELFNRLAAMGGQKWESW